MFARIKHIIVKEFLQSLRDPRKRVFIVVPPLLQLFMFGYVATTDIRNIATAVYDLDHSQESRELMQRFEAAGYFYIKYTPQSAAEIRDLLDRGQVVCVIQINPGFASNLKKRIPTDIQLLVDGSDSNTATIAMNYATRIVTEYAMQFAPAGMLTQLNTLEFRPRVWYNPELRSRNYNIPGVIAMIIMLICLMLTSMAMVREREVGTMEQLMVTPIRPFELILGKTIPFALMGFFDMALITVVGVLWFKVPIKGAFSLLFLGTTIYLLSVLGIGLFISTVTKNQQQALMATMLIAMPAILLSGFMFPIQNMPKIFQYLTYVNPLRYFLVIIRGIFLKGNGLDILWPQMAALLILGTVILTLSALRFHKRLS